MIPLIDESVLDEALRQRRWLLFKHSTRCGTSLRARREVEAFEAASEGLPVYLLDVISDRALSLRIAERVGVRHASPQVILFQGDQPVWNASHGAIRAEVLSERTAVEPEMP